MKNKSASTQTPTPQPIRVRQVLRLVEREAALLDHDPGAAAVVIPSVKEFLEVNGYALESIIDPARVDELSCAVIAGGFGAKSEINLPAGADKDPAYLPRIGALAPAYAALAEADFGGALRRYFKASKLTCREIAAQCGLGLESLRSWLRSPAVFTTNLTPEEALELDAALHAGGKLFASFVATTQHVAYEVLPTVMDEILGRSPFARKLRQLRLGAKLEHAQLLAEVERLSNVRLANSLIAAWEQGRYLPSQDMVGVITALDHLFAANGELVEAWKAASPKKVLSSYSLAFGQWPERLRVQFERIVLYKTKNPQGWKESRRRGGKRWTGTASREIFQNFCQAFFGYLLKEKKFKADSLSVSLLCDWELVLGCFDFVLRRTGKAHYTTYPHVVTSTLLNLYGYYMPHIAAEAVKETYWAGRITLQVDHIVEVLPGVKRNKPVILANLQEAWAHHLDLLKQSARAFLRDNRFDSEPYIEKTNALLQAGAGVFEISALMAARVWYLPVLILSRKAAVLSRRLAAVALLLALNLRPATLRSLRTDQVTVTPDGRIRVNIGGHQFIGKGRGGSQGGLDETLPDVPWIHEALRRYIEEGRPLLVGGAAAGGGKDAGFFLTNDSLCDAPGSPLTKEGLNCDVKIILGYGPLAHRPLLLGDAAGQNVSTKDIAAALQTTEAMVRKAIALLAELKNRKANSATEIVLAPEPKHQAKGGQPPAA
jgi:transcriptional regulator with XRE-family HTH domain